MNVLIVDDEAANRKLLRINLEAEGYSVTEAQDGIAALSVLKNDSRLRADVIISDILMPRMDGYRLCYELRREPQFAHLPIVIYSSTYTSQADESLALEIGADRFFRKPSSFRAMLAALRALPAASPTRCRVHIEEPTILKEYSETLVLKLEKKSVELEEANTRLQHANQTLLARTQELEHAKEELSRTAEVLECRVRERTAQLESANEELEAFNASVSHDLVQPLTAICTLSELMLRDRDLTSRPSIERNLRNIVEAADKMQQTVAALLTLSRSNRGVLDRKPVDVSTIATDILQRLREAHPERQLDVGIAANLYVSADRALLQVAVENLLQNAWKFTAKTPLPRIEVGMQTRAGRSVYFVRDNGAGFDMGQADNLFQPFQRLHKQQDFPGTGIGLTTVRRIIQRHGGEIWAESAPNCGATFYFTL